MATSRQYLISTSRGVVIIDEQAPPDTIEYFAGSGIGVINTTVESGSGHTGDIAQTLPSISQSAAGTLQFNGDIAQTLPSLIQSLTGTLQQNFAGDIAQTLPSLIQSLTGTLQQNFAGDAAQVLPSLTQSLTGTFKQNIAGDIAQTLPSLQQESTATLSTPIPEGGAFAIEEQYQRRFGDKAKKRQTLEDQIRELYEDVREEIEETKDETAREMVFETVRSYVSTEYQQITDSLPPAPVIDWDSISLDLRQIQNTLVLVRARLGARTRVLNEDEEAAAFLLLLQ